LLQAYNGWASSTVGLGLGMTRMKKRHVGHRYLLVLLARISSLIYDLRSLHTTDKTYGVQIVMTILFVPRNWESGSLFNFDNQITKTKLH
jgi:hypothetical protein